MLHVSPASTAGLRARLVYGFGWNTVAMASTQGSTFLINLMLANFWGLQIFGEYAMVQSTLSALVAVAQPGTGVAALKYAAELRERDPSRLGRILGLCGLVSVAIAVGAAGVLFLGARPLATGMFQHPLLSTALTIGAVAVFFNVVSGFLSGAIAGLERYRALAKAGLATGAIYVPICAGAGWAWGVAGAVTGLAVAAGFQSAVLAVVLVRAAAHAGIRLHPLDAWRETTVFHTYVVPAALNGLVAFPALWLGSTFLVRQEQGYGQMALFAAANTLRILVLILPNIFGTVATTLLNNQLGAADGGPYRRVFWMNLSVVGGWVLAGSLGVALLAPWILGVFGHEFRTGSLVLVILMLGLLPEAIATALNQVVQSRERVWLSLFGIVIPSYGTLVLLAWLLTPAHGAVGLAWSYVIGRCIALVASVLLVRHLGLWSANA